MTASGSKPRQAAAPTESRIIERPRLIKLLDETDARVILLTAPAGYGKTTLARQWAKTLQRCVWLTLTPAHRDVAVLGTELGACCAPSAQAEEALQVHLRARPNPQRAATALGRITADMTRAVGVNWIILDDYHEILPSHDAEIFVAELIRRVNARVLVASRAKPGWARPRDAVYGDALEIGAGDLAMSEDEARRLVGRRSDSDQLIKNAAGWPAVLTLARSARFAEAPTLTLSSALYDYFAEEIFQSVSVDLQEQLVGLALLNSYDRLSLGDDLGEGFEDVITAARALGFLVDSGGAPNMHPLLREFLLAKLDPDNPRDRHLIRRAYDRALEQGRWREAFDLAFRFDRSRLEQTLTLAYQPLVAAGQLGTLDYFSQQLRAISPTTPAVADLADADVAARDGLNHLAIQQAGRALAGLQKMPHLQVRAHSIVAQCAFNLGDLSTASEAYSRAYTASLTHQEQLEALTGWALTALQCERPEAADVVARLRSISPRTPIEVLRRVTVDQIEAHFTHGYPVVPPALIEGRNMLSLTTDPRARSSFAIFGAYVHAMRAEYLDALTLLELGRNEVETYELEFARPFVLYGETLVMLGLRRFGDAERSLQALEDNVSRNPVDYHILNMRLLRARLALVTGRPDDALNALPRDSRRTMPSIHGEYYATTALALALNGSAAESKRFADHARQRTTAIEVRVLVQAVLALAEPRSELRDTGGRIWRDAERLGAWDPVLLVARASADFATALSDNEEIRSDLGQLYRRSRDFGLARRAGLRVRATDGPHELLSPRELEVLGLLAQGLTNRQISDALVISPSTTKVHVRHILEKLGVRTRAEAVARHGWCS